MAISKLLVLIGGLEFYCAQVPYSMKGLVAGIIYGLLCIFIMLSQGLLLPFKMTSLEWGTGTLSCGFWYLLTLLIYLLIMMAASVVVMRWYKKRKREDVLPNEQIFAERYYSRNELSTDLIRFELKLIIHDIVYNRLLVLPADLL